MTYKPKSKNLKDRVNKIEHTLQRRKPEQKHYYHNINFPTIANNSLQNVILNAFSQGTTRSSRVGEEIRITQIEVVLYCSDSGMDAQLIKPLASGNVPNAAYFNTTIGSQMNPDEWKVYRAVTFNSSHRRSVSWKVPFPNTLRVQYSQGTTFPDLNTLYLCLHNQTGSTADVQGFVRVWFTDV